MEVINIGIIGFGTVGAGTIEILLKNRELINSRIGCKLHLKKVADIDLERPRPIEIHSSLLTKDAWDLINDPDIHIVVELIGGTDHAKEYILGAISEGKHVVTANKALLAEYGKEIFELAQIKGVSIGFEASVAGGIPIIKALKEGICSNQIRSIRGILNGTSNYILSRMTDDGISYEKAVNEAIRLGYAEDPPTLDVDGTDAAHKLAILTSLAFGIPMPFKAIYREGISKITEDDIRYAGEFGYRIKLLAISKIIDNKIQARVHPCMIPKDHIMAKVDGAFNAIYLEGDFLGPNLYWGMGAGARPTGSAVVADIINISRIIRSGTNSFLPPLAHFRPFIEDIRIQDMDELQSVYYFRFSVIDRPGVLSKISGILGSHGISIHSVIQKGRRFGGSVPVVMLTHEAKERDIKEALSEIDTLDVLTDPTVMIRVEEG